LKQAYSNKELLVASMHRKEQAIGPVFSAAFGMKIKVAADLDTDTFGTFTGEIQRTLSPLDAARAKCREALRLYPQSAFVIASEGSFGPHPQIGLVPADEEILLFLDVAGNQEIWIREISTATNFSALVFSSPEELESFAASCRFPSHALILRDPKSTLIVKGINDWDQLRSSFALIAKTYGSVVAETDMRAMYNPSRMYVIRSAAGKLVQKILSVCPGCGRSGYWISESVPGLPCAACAAPTRSPRAHLYRCEGCEHSGEKPFPSGKAMEDPMYCDNCNP
jgi:hypothetical protein